MERDKKLWKDFLNGENYALSAIYNKNVQMLFRYGKKFSGNNELIKDTIQDLFFDLIRFRENLGRTDNISYYLMAAFRRKLIRNLNNNLSIDNSDHQIMMEVNIIYSEEERLIEREELSNRDKAIKKALSELSPRQREILFYRFTCNFDYQQICELMNLKYDSARKLASRGIKSLHKVLNDSVLFSLFVAFLKK